MAKMNRGWDYFDRESSYATIDALYTTNNNQNEELASWLIDCNETLKSVANVSKGIGHLRRRNLKMRFEEDRVLFVRPLYSTFGVDFN